MAKQNWHNIKKLALGIVAFEGTEHLYNIISELHDLIDYVSVGVQDVSYHGDPLPAIDKQELNRLQKDGLIDTIISIKLDLNKHAREQETDKRNKIIEDAEQHGCSHIIVIDSDEYYTHASFLRGLVAIDANDYEQTYCQYINYYHDYNHVLIYPFKDGMFVPFVTKTKYRYGFESVDFNKPSDPTRRYLRPYDREEIRKGADGKNYKFRHFTVDYHIFEWNEVKMHHLSWVRADIRKKLNMWSSKKCFDNFYDLIDKAVYTFEQFDPNSPKAEAVMLFNTPGNKVDVKSLPRQYIHPKADINTRLLPCKDYKKILFINMSSTASNYNLYNTLDKCCRETWAKPIIDGEFLNCDFWTIVDTNKNSYMDSEHHIIYIKNVEGKDNISQLIIRYIEGVKMLEAGGHTYDYIVRTNTSTWVNVDLLNSFLADETDDSILYAFKIFAAYWSCFNFYASGACMIFSKRNMDILKAVYVQKKLADIENVYDDVVMSSVFYSRLVEMNLPQERFIQSLNGENLLLKYVDTPFATVDFTNPIYQVKTYNVSEADRVTNDVKKMKELTKMWNEYKKNQNIDEIAASLREVKNKTVWTIPYTKKDWFNLPDSERLHCQLHHPMAIPEALKVMGELKKKAGYTK